MQEQFVQIVNVNKNHWIALSTSTVGCQKACIRIYDCNGDKELPKSTLKLISALLQTQEDQFAVEFIDVQMQEGSHVCGLFAVAYITSICNGKDPAVLLYKQNAMRKHILKSLLQVDVPRHLPGRIYRYTVFAGILMMAPK